MLYSKDYSMRVVDWRWWRVEGVAGRRQPPKDVKNDGFMNRLYRFMRQRRKLDSQRWQRREQVEVSMREQDPAVYEAYEIWRENSDRRGAIEALAVAGADDDDIAETLGLPVETVATYLALFYDVRDRLCFNLFPMTLIPEIYTAGMLHVPPATLWKYFGWQCGPELLKAGWRRDDSPELKAAVNRLCVHELAVNALYAAIGRCVNGDTAHDVVSESPTMARLRNQDLPVAESEHDRLCTELLGSIQIGMKSELARSERIARERETPEFGDAVRRLRGLTEEPSHAPDPEPEPEELAPEHDEARAAKIEKVKALGKRLRERAKKANKTPPDKAGDKKTA